MAGKQGQRGSKPRAVPERYRPGWLQAIDRRYAPAKLASAQLIELQEALGGGETLSPQQRMLTEHVTWLHLRLQQLGQEFLAGQGLDAQEFTALFGSLTSGLRLLGVKRVPKDVPNLHEYMRRRTIESKEVGKP